MIARLQHRLHRRENGLDANLRARSNFTTRSSQPQFKSKVVRDITETHVISFLEFGYIRDT